MDAFFRAVAIGLGVLMGTLNQGVEPDLQVTVRKADSQVLVSATLEQGLSPKMDEALAAGVPLALTLRADVGTPGTSVTQVLSYDSLGRQWQVVRAGESPRVFSTRSEAERAWGLWLGVPAGVPPQGAFTATVQVSLSFPDRPEWQADMVWKSPVLTWQKTFTRLSEIPF